jgi:hypothetical protein
VAEELHTYKCSPTASEALCGTPTPDPFKNNKGATSEAFAEQDTLDQPGHATENDAFEEMLNPGTPLDTEYNEPFTAYE